MCPCCVSQISLFWRHVWEINITSRTTWCISLNSSSSLSLEFIDRVFFCKTMNVVLSFNSPLLAWGEALLLLLPLHSAPVVQVLVASDCTASAFSPIFVILFSVPGAALSFSFFVVSFLLLAKNKFVLYPHFWRRYQFQLFHLSRLFFLFVFLFMTTRSHRNISSLHPNFTTAHSGSYEFFVNHFSMRFWTSSSTSSCL